MWCFANKKIRNGKFIKVWLLYREKIERVKLEGDFFLYPEEKIWELESSLCGIKPGEVFDTIKGFTEKTGIKMVGISPTDICEVIMAAVENADESNRE